VLGQHYLAIVIAALQTVRSCILVREHSHMYGGERTAMELLQTSFIADLQGFTGLGIEPATDRVGCLIRHKVRLKHGYGAVTILS